MGKPECGSVWEYYLFETFIRHKCRLPIGHIGPHRGALTEWIDADAVCPGCGHQVSLHEAEYGCDYEADRPDVDIGQVAYRCGCKAVVAVQEASQ